MKRALMTTTIVFGLIASVASAQPAKEIAAVPQVDPSGTMAEDQALEAYRQNINPNVVVPTTGPYDERDRYAAPNGYELPGYGRLPPS
jgi:hypothetical protein